jgi:hypothetical protein
MVASVEDGVRIGEGRGLRIRAGDIPSATGGPMIRPRHSVHPTLFLLLPAFLALLFLSAMSPAVAAQILHSPLGPGHLATDGTHDPWRSLKEEAGARPGLAPVVTVLSDAMLRGWYRDVPLEVDARPDPWLWTLYGTADVLIEIDGLDYAIFGEVPEERFVAWDGAPGVPYPGRGSERHLDTRRGGHAGDRPRRGGGSPRGGAGPLGRGGAPGAGAGVRRGTAPGSPGHPRSHPASNDAGDDAPPIREHHGAEDRTQPGDGGLATPPLHGARGGESGHGKQSPPRGRR